MDDRLVNVHYLDKASFVTKTASDNEEVVVFDTSPSYDEVVIKVRDKLNWMDPNDKVELIGRYDVGVGTKSRLKNMPIISELHWGIYKGKVAASEDMSLELFATKGQGSRLDIDLNRQVSSPCRSVARVVDSAEVYAPNTSSQPSPSQENEVVGHALEKVNEQYVDGDGDVQCGHGDDDDDMHEDETHANEKEKKERLKREADMACKNKKMAQEEERVRKLERARLALEDGCSDDDEQEDEIHGNDIGDLEAFVRQQDMDREIPYGRAYAYDSDDEGPEEELDVDGFTERENRIHIEVTGLEIRTPLFRDLRLAHKAVVDGGMSKAIEPRACPEPGEPRVKGEDENAYLKKGLKFVSLQAFKVWLSDYAIRNHRPYLVGHSDQKVRYSIHCDKEGCPWAVHGRRIKTGQWLLTSCVCTHSCRPPSKKKPKTHRQLTSEFLGFKLMKEVSSDPTVKVKLLMTTVKKMFGYKVKYGKTWKAKSNALRMLYGSWEEAYNRLPRLLGAIAHRNPGMYHVVEDDGHGVFHRAFWSFGQCITAFKHCHPVLSIDGTFLTGRYKGTIMVAMAHSSNDNVLPVAFGLVPFEHQDNWEWFMRHVRENVIGDREVCIISDRHQGILKAMDIVIPGLPKLHHRWCMRHFVANFYRACKSKELSKDLTHVCVAFSTGAFIIRYDKLYEAANEGGKDFLT